MHTTEPQRVVSSELPEEAHTIDLDPEHAWYRNQAHGLQDAVDELSKALFLKNDEDRKVALLSLCKRLQRAGVCLPAGTERLVRGILDPRVAQAA